jgi:hypothetical protein
MGRRRFSPVQGRDGQKGADLWPDSNGGDKYAMLVKKVIQGRDIK